VGTRHWLHVTSHGDSLRANSPYRECVPTPVLASAPIEDLMPLNDADRAWIRETIRTAHERNVLGKVTGFIKDWGGTGAAVAILIFALMRWEAYVEFRTNTNNRLANIEKILGGIQADLAKQSLINQAALPLPDFKATLPDLSAALAIAKQQNVKISPKVIGDLQDKLTASTNASSFWPTAAEFISYRSQVTATDFQSLIHPDLPKCADHAPIPVQTKEGGPANGEWIPSYYHDCRFTLDSEQEVKELSTWLDDRAFVLTFRHCQIAWHGGEINLLTTLDNSNKPGPAYTSEGAELFAVSGRYLHFEDCLFLFTVSSTPAQDGQEFTQQLLTQNGRTIDFPRRAPSAPY
jgi:hypothetical protein